MRLLATILVLLSPLLARASDEPARIGDDAFALPVSADGAEVRVASPEVLARGSRPDVRMLGLARVVFPDWAFIVTAATQNLDLFAASAEQLDQYVDGAEGGVQDLCSGAHAHGDTPGSRWRVVFVGGASALRFRLDCDTKGPTGVDYVLAYVVNQPGREVLVDFIGDHEHAAAIERAAQRMLGGARVQRSRAPMFGRPRAFQIGYRVGRVLAPLALLLLLAWATVRARRKR